MKLNFDSHHTRKPLPVQQKGKKVWIPDRKGSGQVQDQISNHSRSFLVNTLSDAFRRNIVNLRKLLVVDPQSPKEQQHKMELNPTINQDQPVVPSNSQPVSNQHQPQANVPKSPKPVQTRLGRMTRKPVRLVEQ